MTPKEKANELYELMFYKLNDYNAICIDIESKDECAKQCALIAVDEILKAVNNPDETYLMKHSVNYWTEVKQEIEKL